MRGSKEVWFCGTICDVVHHRSAAVTVESPVEVAVTLVWDPEASRPCSVIPTCEAAAPVLVTMLSQRMNVPLLGTNTLRVTERPRASNVCVWKVSCRLTLPCGQSWAASPAPGL